MKISKKTKSPVVVSSDEWEAREGVLPGVDEPETLDEEIIEPASDEVFELPEDAPVEEIEPVETCMYPEACTNIQLAIDSLTTAALDDPLARDAIANLSVVLFELK